MNALRRWASARGWALAWGPVDAIRLAREDVLDIWRRGAIHDVFARTWLERFTSEPPQLEWGRTALAVAVPRPAHIIWFDLQDGPPLRTLLPPTYVGDADIDIAVREAVAQALAPARVDVPNVPRKALAARLGLVRYGRNGIAYTAVMGSYHQLVPLVTDARLDCDLVAPEATGSKPGALPACAECRACIDACPTGAISEEGFVLRGERCVTAVNELPGEWPPWLEPPAIDCLVGCLRCQRACPYNRKRLRTEAASVRFTPAETSALLAGSTPSASADAAREATRKLELLSLTEYGPALGRNLALLLRRQQEKG